MVAIATTSAGPKHTVSPRHALLETLIGIVGQHVNDQLLGLSGRLAAALLDTSVMPCDAATVYRRFKAGKLLKSDAYAFLHLSTNALERAVRLEIVQLAPAPKMTSCTPPQPMSLVPFEEMDSRVAFGALSRPFDVLYADQLATLDVRMAVLFDRDTLRIGQNPFRPEVFLMALQQAWCEFASDTESNDLLLPLLTPELCLDLGPMLEALNLALMRNGILPGSVACFAGRKAHDAAPKMALAADQTVLARQLRQFLLSNDGGAVVGHDPGLPMPGLPPAGTGRFAAPGFHVAAEADYAAQAGARQPLLSYLARLQQAGAAGAAAHAAAGTVAGTHNAISLPGIKQSAPKGSLTRADENTIDLLTAIFEAVFHDQNISQEIRDLIRFLQIPVLKAALADQDFFFQEAHPARRLIDLLSRMGWEQRQGPEDPLFKAMRHSVECVGRDPEHRLAVFSAAVSDMEASIEAEENAATMAIAEPIAHAMKQEKRVQAARSASAAVALRLGSGEVLAVVETFLEQKWVTVLTIAYSAEDEKPGAVRHATRAMDELIWSVKPKLGMDERKQFIGKLPGLLSALNQWLDIIKWQDADRLQFFAELAECHASIVRAPVDLSPGRQVEIALEVAQKAAERRLERQRRVAPDVPADDAELAVDALQRGMWMEFAQVDGAGSKVKLAWISPLRTLFIFATSLRQEAFSMQGEILARHFRDDRVRVIGTDGMVGRALSMSMAQVAAVNDPSIDPSIDPQQSACA